MFVIETTSRQESDTSCFVFEIGHRTRPVLAPPSLLGHVEPVQARLMEMVVDQARVNPPGTKLSPNLQRPITLVGTMPNEHLGKTIVALEAVFTKATQSDSNFFIGIAGPVQALSELLFGVLSPRQQVHGLVAGRLRRRISAG
jgi:hypothetical protein